jgi:hypothetical protein
MIVRSPMPNEHHNEFYCVEGAEACRNKDQLYWCYGEEDVCLLCITMNNMLITQSVELSNRLQKLRSMRPGHSDRGTRNSNC